MCDAWDVSVALCTYNRCRVLHDAIESVLSQQPTSVRYELIVVDNNSTDDTKRVVDRFVTRGCSNLRYVFESQQGLSYARNRAVSVARAPLLAFTDDDIRVDPHWIATIKRTFDSHPDAAWIGGKVLPTWAGVPPKWLTTEHWSPLAVQDHGDVPFYITSERQLCLIGANLAIRKSVLEASGGFQPDLQRVADSVGSMEDHELQIRMWKADRRGFYMPDLVVMSDVAPDRLTKKYHRRWHRGHGHFYAKARLDEWERSSVGWLFDVASHVYKNAALDAFRWLTCVARGNFSRAFKHETDLLFFVGFFRTHYREFVERGERSHLRELTDFARSLMRRMIHGPGRRKMMRRTEARQRLEA
jgi:glycosyltransferase involved in cell wall biosynthesis